jgi:hypothetical protein
LPPGYIQGFEVTLRKDYTVLVTGGSANVGGRQVTLSEDHQLTLQDWIVPRMDTPQHYYLYLSKDGNIYVDIVKPKFDSFYGYYAQPAQGWRVIGKMFVKSTDIIYAIKDVGRSGRTVTVAPVDYIGYADYYCDGVSDEILINAALIYVWSAYQGGTVQLLEGTFNIASSVYNTFSNITLNGSGNGTIISGSATAYIKFEGTVGVPITKVKISNLLIYNSWITFIYTNNSTIYQVTIRQPNSDSTKGAINLDSGTADSITNCFILGESTGDTRRGIRASGSQNIISGNTIQGLRASTGILSGIVSVGGYAVISNNVIYDLSDSAASLTTGMYVYSDYNIISGNRIEQVKNTNTASFGKGINTASGTWNSITNNYCINNGSDLDISNTNSCNFLDAATDTQCYSNSWQSPVAGEPSLGTPHVHSVLLNNNSSYAGAATETLTASGVPTGTKAIAITGYLNSAGTQAFSFTDVAGTIFILSVCNAGTNGNFYGVVPLDSNKQFKFVHAAAVTGMYSYYTLYDI